MKYFMRVLVLLIITILVSNNTSIAEGQSYPCLIIGEGNADCQMVLQCAKIAFQSKEPYLCDSGVAIRNKDHALVLWPAEAPKTAEFSYELKFDPERIIYAGGSGGAAKKLFLQKRPADNTRFAVRERSMNWKGDLFDLILIKSEKNPDQIIKMLQPLEHDAFQDKPPAGIQVIGEGMWQYPWLFYNQKSNHYLAVDTQPPYEFFADWNIYTSDKNGNKVYIGKIAFRPPAKDAFHALPIGPLHSLAILLDQIIGNPQTEGTYNPFDYLRGNVQNMWGDLLYRPWAIAQPRTTRQQVERHFWSKGASVFRRRYNELQKLYPKAVAQLTTYYEQHFHKSHAEASAMAAKSLDLALRSHFILD